MMKLPGKWGVLLPGTWGVLLTPLLFWAAKGRQCRTPLIWDAALLPNMAPKVMRAARSELIAEGTLQVNNVYEWKYSSSLTAKQSGRLCTYICL